MPLTVDIPGSVLELMEERRILIADVLAVLEHASKNGPMFQNPDTKRAVACLRPRQVTFWVEYEELPGDRKKVCRVWCHRMTFAAVPGEGRESPASEEGFAKDGGRVRWPTLSRKGAARAGFATNAPRPLPPSR